MMIINNRKDLESLPKAEQEAFKQKLSTSINGWQWDGEWVQVQNTASLEQFGFTLADFPDAPVPPKPTNNPDADALDQERLERIAELKTKLAETDYVTLSDYDQEKPDVIAERAAWRTEIRTLQGT